MKWPFPWQFDRALYPDLYLMSRVSEGRVQTDIVDFLQLYKIDAVPIDAGGRRQRGRMMGAARAAGVDLAGVQNVKTGRAIPAGFADIEATLAPTGRALYIEVKAPAWIYPGTKKLLRSAGRPTNDQLEFLLSKYERGALVMVAWSAADVERWFGKYLQRNRSAL
jgi:hypothetical protein